MTHKWTYPRLMGDASRRTVGAERTIRDWQESAYQAAPPCTRDARYQGAGRNRDDADGAATTEQQLQPDLRGTETDDQRHHQGLN